MSFSLPAFTIGVFVGLILIFVVAYYLGVFDDLGD